MRKVLCSLSLADNPGPLVTEGVVKVPSLVEGVVNVFALVEGVASASSLVGRVVKKVHMVRFSTFRPQPPRLKPQTISF